MKQVLIKAGEASVVEVPAPGVGDRNILVAVEFSCISSGTEVAGLVNSGVPLYQRALRQPQNVALAFRLMKEQGISRTVKQIRGMLNAGQSTGYSATGRVIEVGREVEGFAPGELVACAGAGIANHAEIIDVPVNLAVKVPRGLDLRDAATVTLGSIALQGIRRASPTLGETFVVSGLGILGQLTAQMLKMNGCTVIGVEPGEERRRLADENGIDFTLDPGEGDCVERIMNLTEGLGADAVIITASGDSSGIISDAMRSCRKKGRVILVGDVGLQLRREDFYVKELDFLVSTSYGPGRYDPYYELQGNDYPIGHVRWTENRNMQAYLKALSKGDVRLANLKGGEIPLDEVGQAYGGLKDGSLKGLVHIIKYPGGTKRESRVTSLPVARLRGAKVGAALVGAGEFAQGSLLPNLLKLRRHFHLQAVVSQRGSNAMAVARQYEAGKASTDIAEVLGDPEVDLVLIATRHHLHASLALNALKAGKHVFVEKPLALSRHELESIKEWFKSRLATPLLMTGFNRRFSPPVEAVRALLQKRVSPLMINYRMNAGYLPLSHWVHGEEGGGRNIGEACHIYDLFNHLTGSQWLSVKAECIRSSSAKWAHNDNFVATVAFADGSVCNLIYTALGDRSYPKETMEIFFDQRVITMTDYRVVEEAGKSRPVWSSKTSRKGHLEEFSVLASALTQGGEWPITLDDQMAAMEIAFSVEEALRQGAGNKMRSEQLEA